MCGVTAKQSSETDKIVHATASPNARPHVIDGFCSGFNDPLYFVLRRLLRNGVPGVLKQQVIEKLKRRFLAARLAGKANLLAWGVRLRSVVGGIHASHHPNCPLMNRFVHY